MPSTVSASQPPSRARLLVVAEVLPRPDESSGSSRFLAILMELARHARVDLWVELDETTGRTPLPAPRIAADRQRLEEAGVHVLPCGWPALRHALAQQYEMVFCEFYHVAARYQHVLRDQQPSAALVIDSVDVHYARLAAGVAIGAVHPDWARQVHAEETAVYRGADAVVVASVDDAGILGREPDMPPAIFVPNSSTIRSRSSGPRRPKAVFVGHFHHAPNFDGLRWFVHDVWPLVRRRHAAAQLTVIGSYASADVHALGDVAGVVIAGYVPDIAPYLDRAAVAIAPLRFGAGMKGKVTEAMAAGLPVVTTSVGAQGLDIVHGHHAWIADDASSFAGAMLEVFADPEKAAAVAAAGQHYIDGVCGQAALATAVGELLRTRRRAPGNTAPDTRLRKRLRLARVALAHGQLTMSRRLAAWFAPSRPGLMGKAAQPS